MKGVSCKNDSFVPFHLLKRFFLEKIQFRLLGPFQGKYIQPMCKFLIATRMLVFSAADLINLRWLNDKSHQQ